MKIYTNCFKSVLYSNKRGFNFLSLKLHISPIFAMSFLICSRNKSVLPNTRALLLTLNLKQLYELSELIAQTQSQNWFLINPDP